MMLLNDGCAQLRSASQGRPKPGRPGPEHPNQPTGQAQEGCLGRRLHAPDHRTPRSCVNPGDKPGFAMWVFRHLNTSAAWAMLRRTKMVRSKILCLFEKMDLPRASEAEAAKVTVSFSQASAVPATMAWQCRDRLHDGAPSPHLQGGMTVDCGQLSRLVPLSWRCLA